MQVKRPKGCSPGLFGVNKLSGKADCVVTEGEFDAMLVWQEASNLVDVLTLGGKSQKLADRWLPFLLPIQRFWIATDNDEGGHQAAAYWLELTGKQGKRILPPGGAKDIGESWLAGADIRAWVQSALSSESTVTPQGLVPVSQGNGTTETCLRHDTPVLPDNCPDWMKELADGLAARLPGVEMIFTPLDIPVEDGKDPGEADVSGEDRLVHM